MRRDGDFVTDVRFSIDREGSTVTLAARAPDGQSATFELSARGAGALAANLVLATHEQGDGWETEFTARGKLEVTK